MTTVRFGTDGIRGIAGETLTVELAAALGVALMQQHPAGLVLIGRDTRPSGPALASALAGAIEAHGGTVIDVGVIPTPGLASLVAGEPRAACGVVVTASHNPVEYNGLKVLARDGRKIPDVEERALEAAMEIALAEPVQVAAPSVVHAAEAQEYRGRYERTLGALAQTVDAAGLRVVVDAAHGAASPFAVAALAATGATVLPFAMGDGVINDGVGATDPAALGEQAGRGRGAGRVVVARALGEAEKRGRRWRGPCALARRSWPSASTGMCMKSMGASSIRTRRGFWTCRCRTCPDRIRSRTPGLRSLPCASSVGMAPPARLR